VAGIAQRNVINNQDQKPIQITYQGGTTNLYYDGAGERIKKVKGAETVIYVGGIYEVRNGQAMSYVYANGQKIVTRTGNKEYYTHSDHLGSTAIVTDETGAVVEEIGYLPFGSTLFRNTYNGSTWASAYRFTGQEFDPEYHLYNYNARLYDPIMSRFITPDTIIPNPYNPQSMNRYSYCLNNPLNYIDPSGHTSMTYDEWLAYMAMAQQAYSLYQVWPQMGLIMWHDFSMGFDSFHTGFEMAAVDPDTVILAQLLAGVQASGVGGGNSNLLGDEPGDIFTIGFNGGVMLTTPFPFPLGFDVSADRVVMSDGKADWFITAGLGVASPGISIGCDRGKIWKTESTVDSLKEKGIGYIRLDDFDYLTHDITKDDVKGFSISLSLDLKIIGPFGAGGEFSMAPFATGTSSMYGETTSTAFTLKGGPRSIFSSGFLNPTGLFNWTFDIGD
jgi:RHS repeat-associated protein